MTKEPLIICNVVLGYPHKLNDPEADLAWTAPETLNEFYRFSHPILFEALLGDQDPDAMTRMMAVLPHIAEYYEVDKTALLESWCREYGLNELRGVLQADD